MNLWGLYANADDNYERWIVAVFETKKDARTALKTLRREDHSHLKSYWGLDEVPFVAAGAPYVWQQWA